MGVRDAFFHRHRYLVILRVSREKNNLHPYRTPDQK
jgi:hypothetical protein